MNDYEFGNFLYELRKKRGLTQKELGDKLGVKNKAVSQWEMGISKPRTGKLRTLAEILGVTVDELLACKRAAPKEDARSEIAFAINVHIREIRRARRWLVFGIASSSRRRPSPFSRSPSRSGRSTRRRAA